MFTVIFAVARTVGWISQWKEMIGMEKSKISRPSNFILVKQKETLLILKIGSEKIIIKN